MAGPLVLQNKLLYHIRSYVHQWLKFALLSHCQSRLDFLLCIVQEDTELFYPPALYTDRTGGTKRQQNAHRVLALWPGASLRSQGSDSRSKDSLTHCLVLSTVALFAFYGGPCCMQKYFGFAWIRGEGSLLLIGFWTCGMTLLLLSHGCPGRVQYFVPNLERCQRPSSR